MVGRRWQNSEITRNKQLAISGNSLSVPYILLGYLPLGQVTPGPGEGHSLNPSMAPLNQPQHHILDPIIPHPKYSHLPQTPPVTT